MKGALWHDLKVRGHPLLYTGVERAVRHRLLPFLAGIALGTALSVAVLWWPNGRMLAVLLLCGTAALLCLKEPR